MFGQIETLVRKIDYSSMKAEHAVKKVASSGDPVKQASYNNAGAGTVNMAVNLENQKRFKRGSVNAFQNALSMMQAQTEALGQADKIYNRMRSLAQIASDPMMNSDDRVLLSEQFNDLREQARNLGNSKFNDVFLFDGRAASTKYEINFTSGLTNDTPHDGTFTHSSGQTWKYWEVTKDVIYNSGKMSIDVNGGQAPERYLLKQGDQIIFDTGEWATRGDAKQYDYDRFIVEWGPDQKTSFMFQPLSDGNTKSIDLDGPDNKKGTPDDGVLPSDSTYHNKDGFTDNYTKKDSGYLIQLGLNDDGTSSGMDSVIGKVYTEKQGQVEVFSSDPSSTQLTLRIESKSLFQIDSKYELPEVEPDYVARNDDLQVKLEKLGLGLMRDSEVENFPLISIDTAEDAQKAIASMSKELDGLGEQLGRLASNFNQVNNAMSATEELEYMSEKVLSEIGGQNLTNDLLTLSKSRINRAQDTALLTQAMSIHQDLVNVLIH